MLYKLNHAAQFGFSLSFGRGSDKVPKGFRPCAPGMRPQRPWRGLHCIAAVHHCHRKQAAISYSIYYGKTKNVPNHQPVIIIIIIIHYRNIDLCSATIMIVIDTYVPNLRCPKSEVSIITVSLVITILLRLDT